MDARLPPDQRAVLDLLVTQARGYGEIAALLRLDAAAVRGRAHTALTTLAGAPPAPGEDLADHVLGQQEPTARRATARALRRSPEARAWIADASTALGLPAPPEPATAPDPDRAPAPRRARRGPDRRRLIAGGVLIAVVALAAVAIVVLATSGDAGSGAAATTTAPAAQPQVQPEAQAALRAPGGATTPAGALVFGRLGPTRQVVAMQAQGLPRTTETAAYVLWLEPAQGAALGVAFLPAVARDGQLTFQAQLEQPIDLRGYRRVFVTRERSGRAAPETPGRSVLAGPLAAPTAG